MKLSDFSYEYPKELIAQHPLKDRDSSRMMVLNRSQDSLEHSKISNIVDFLNEGDLLIVNDSKVVPARLFGRRRNGEEIELLVVEPKQGMTNTWRCLLKKAKRINKNEKFFFGMQATAKSLGRDDIYLLMEFKGNSLDLAMKHHGVPPLPPYIEREGFEAYSNEDRQRYQTVYANRAGSAAAPTAGLHFGENLMERIESAGIEIQRVTLHVGIDTFAPVRVDDIKDHRMHGEKVEISEDVAKSISNAKAEGRRIIAVGTTTTRALESAAINANEHGSLKPGKWTTDIFITPGFEFKLVNAMVTNFHQPRSTLLMMVSAFAGRDFILKSYGEAISERYRLFSYGDCMLIL
jgi:S-adenosylmethionine:tRNA ribosyltransferase-isomerase